ncbi:hypothetical protein ASC76_10145 [Rhizobacter sp. Root404]|nr:hypothetical protein ASC76_10145 [Rhizobacter sp. Root404]
MHTNFDVESMIKNQIAAAIALLASNAVHAGFITGNELHDMYDKAPAHATAYVLGVFDTYATMRSCYVPSGVTGAQVSDVVRAFLKASPAVRHKPANELVRAISEEAWPCYGKKYEYPPYVPPK